jgi:hypothetical protein
MRRRSGFPFPGVRGCRERPIPKPVYSRRLMTPELAQVVATRARALRGRLTPGTDPPSVAIEARRLFEDASDAVRVRWLNLELAGYETATRAIGPLPRVLGGPQGIVVGIAWTSLSSTAK